MIDTKKWFTHAGNNQQKIEFLIDYLKKSDLTLPDDFVGFYEKYNGVIISDYAFAFHLDIPTDYEYLSELFFYSFFDVKSIIELSKSQAGWNFPNKMITFTNRDPGSIILSLDPLSHGEVFFCESDLLEEQLEGYCSIDEAVEYFDYPNKPLPKYMFKIAGSFTEFLEKIEVKER